MKLTVNTPSGKTTTLEVESSTSITTLKQKLFEFEGLSIDQQIVYLDEKPLDDLEATLADYHLADSVTLTLKSKKVVNKCSYTGCPKRPALIVGDCRYCAKRHCAQHRLPETHNCLNLQDCRQQSYDKNKEKLMREKCVGVKV
eukprot:TRINITY_DN149_c0_g1_i2.p1 TRINITY_DN149_c0_g1~~TRINITY_DN149_c0_g1_i2.p1  ORF type:complete len:143 (+),score=17.97 TRINITY_DN149_c0_g1_i2:82-510(+)